MRRERRLYLRELLILDGLDLDTYPGGESYAPLEIYISLYRITSLHFGW